MPPDHSLRLALSCALALLGIVVCLMIGCAQPIVCPPGTAAAYASSAVSGGGDVEATLPRQGGSASAKWDGKSAWGCRRVCPPGSLFEADGLKQRCVATEKCATVAPKGP